MFRKSFIKKSEISAMQKKQRQYTVVGLVLGLICIPTTHFARTKMHCTKNMLIHVLCMAIPLLITVGLGGVENWYMVGLAGFGWYTQTMLIHQK